MRLPFLWTWRYRKTLRAITDITFGDVHRLVAAVVAIDAAGGVVVEVVL